MSQSAEKFLKPGKNAYRIASSDQIDVLIDAATYYKAVYQSILKARRTLLFSGWQFDSRVCLLRGKDAEEATYPVEFLPLLQRAASERPELQIYILAWDHSIIFAPEREWWQGYRFHNVSDQIHFQFDNVHPTNASHHQKIVVADGQVGFCGGLDICGDRWDTPQHRRRNPLRANTDGTRYDLFHDVQVAVQGEAVRVLKETFCDRWATATGTPLHLPADRQENGTDPPWDLPHSVRLPGMPVGISRTVPVGACGVMEPIREIAQFYVDAIDAAERFIFIENQYFTSRTIFEALIKRLQQKDRPPLEVIIILPHRPQNWKEQLAIGFEQRRMIERLEAVAKEAGGAVGAFTPIKKGDPSQSLPPKLIYVHSKVLVVDDWLLSIGSANTTNRSLGLDTECNINLEAEDEPQRRHISRTCLTLLAEHLEQPVDAVEALFKDQKSWVAYLNTACKEGKSGRLQKLNEVNADFWVDQILPEGIYFDPETPLQAESFFEEVLGLYDDEEKMAEGEEEGTKANAPQPMVASEKTEGSPLPSRKGVLLKGLLLAILPLIGLAAFLFLQPQKLDAIFWVHLLEEVRASTWTLPLFLTGMVAASLISFPIVSLLILGGILFGPLWGTVWGMTGALLGATASYFIGDYLGEPLLKRWGGKKVDAAKKWVEKKGFWAIVILRVVGIFPFTLVNFCAGASRMPFTQYLAGTAAGMLPGTFVISYFAHSMLEGTVRFPSKKLQLLSGMVLLSIWLTGSLLKKWWVHRKSRIPKHA
jgi:phosphatidylserine/phosphatidylglycerophosphate/cardiolipin synthase-like enzyme/uncharacterized membrane protein YdjX (TVP38/TMEM64 family)